MANITKVDYKTLKDAELMALCHERGITAPLSEEGRILRFEAMKMLREQDELAAKNDVSERVWVVFHNSGNPSAGPYVYASINGKNFQAPYEKEVCIPKYFLTECIDRACTVERKYNLQEDGSMASTVKRIPTYPYTILRPATEEDYK